MLAHVAFIAPLLLVPVQASVDHLKLFLDQATEALNQHDWMEAGAALDRCDYESQKVAKTVGN